MLNLSESISYNTVDGIFYAWYVHTRTMSCQTTVLDAISCVIICPNLGAEREVHVRFVSWQVVNDKKADAWHPHTALTSRSSWVSHCKASLDGCRSSKLLKHCSTWMHMEHLGSMPNDHFVEKRPAEIWWKSDFGQDIFEKTSDLVTLFP